MPCERGNLEKLASKLAPTGICGGRRQSCGSWLASDGITAVWLSERGANGSRASSLLQEFVVVGRSCGSWLASDDITAVWRNDRGASGSRASSLLQGFVVVGGSCGSWLASDDITAVWLSERGASGSRASSLLQGFMVAGGNLVGAGLPAMTSLRFGGTTETPMAREQARSYRDLWWPADPVGAGLPAMASLRSV